MSYTNADICEIVAKNEGYSRPITTEKNISEWYGFSDKNGNFARFKVCREVDKSGSGKFNFYKKKLDCNEPNVNAIYIVVLGSTHIYYRQIDCSGEFPNTSDPKIVIAKDDLTNVSWNSLIRDEMILEVISATNVHYNRILDRNENVEKEAIEALVQENKICCYCGISQTQIDSLENFSKASNGQKLWCFNYGLTKRNHRKTLEIDQKDPTNGYVKGNIVWACSWCNNAKTDTFTYEEFRVIAKNINCIWNERFKQIGSTEKVVYPWTDNPEECR